VSLLEREDFKVSLLEREDFRVSLLKRELPDEFILKNIYKKLHVLLN